MNKTSLSGAMRRNKAGGASSYRGEAESAGGPGQPRGEIRIGDLHVDGTREQVHDPLT
jgi:hypothetical protein